MSEDFEPSPGRSERGRGPWMSALSPEEYREKYGQEWGPGHHVGDVGYFGGYDDAAMKEQEPELWQAVGDMPTDFIKRWASLVDPGPGQIAVLYLTHKEHQEIISAKAFNETEAAKYRNPIRIRAGVADVEPSDIAVRKLRLQEYEAIHRTTGLKAAGATRVQAMIELLRNFDGTNGDAAMKGQQPEIWRALHWKDAR